MTGGELQGESPARRVAASVCFAGATFFLILLTLVCGRRVLESSAGVCAKMGRSAVVPFPARAYAVVVT
jgi:hypothetical protein